MSTHQLSKRLLFLKGHWFFVPKDVRQCWLPVRVPTLCERRFRGPWLPRTDRLPRKDVANPTLESRTPLGKCVDQSCVSKSSERLDPQDSANALDC